MTASINPVIAEDLETILEADLPWSSLESSTVVVTGAAGFLPAYLVEALAALNARGAGIRIVGLVRHIERARTRFAHLESPSSGLQLIQHDVSQPVPDSVPTADFIVHAASQASPRFYGSDPVGTLSANTQGTSHLLEYAHRGPVRSFLFFSSGEVYGVPVDDSRRLEETDYGYLDPATVRACYAESKRMGETLCVAWAHQHGVPARIVRPFHTYGPSMSLTDGRVFADFVADVVARRDIVLKSDGLALRPFCYLADATVAFFTVLLKGEIAKPYNVGNPDAEISIGNLASLIIGLHPQLGLQVVRPVSNIEASGYLKSAVLRSTPDVGRIAELGWRATTTLQQGFRRTLRSFDPRLT